MLQPNVTAPRHIHAAPSTGEPLVDGSKDFPAELVGAIDGYRDRCRRGGDSIPERVVLEVAIAQHAAGLVTRALEVTMPERPAGDLLLAWVDKEIAQSDEYAASHARTRRYTAEQSAEARAESEYWSGQARMFRVLRERLMATERAA